VLCNYFEICGIGYSFVWLLIRNISEPRKNSGFSEIRPFALWELLYAILGNFWNIARYCSHFTVIYLFPFSSEILDSKHPSL